MKEFDLLGSWRHTFPVAVPALWNEFLPEIRMHPFTGVLKGPEELALHVIETFSFYFDPAWVRYLCIFFCFVLFSCFEMFLTISKESKVGWQINFGTVKK